ncbi:hypothetical protein BDZ45DRAFT_410513 [Acephala macrosclerotiorum]|nr:hypothetical protein BDZ45DRAFT_410513 [Acephala macrosclerotiorum]
MSQILNLFSRTGGLSCRSILNGVKTSHSTYFPASRTPASLHHSQWQPYPANEFSTTSLLRKSNHPPKPRKLQSSQWNERRVGDILLDKSIDAKEKKQALKVELIKQGNNECFHRIWWSYTLYRFGFPVYFLPLSWRIMLHRYRIPVYGLGLCLVVWVVQEVGKWLRLWGENESGLSGEK